MTPGSVSVLHCLTAQLGRAETKALRPAPAEAPNKPSSVPAHSTVELEQADARMLRPMQGEPPRASATELRFCPQLEPG